MKKEKLMNACMILCLIGLTGCGNQSSDLKQNTIQQSEISKSKGAENSSVNSTGQGFKPPIGSHVNKEGNIVDKDGNTFDQEGNWEVPEGGHVDAGGRIYDKNGTLMGGGAKKGSKG